MPREQEPFSVEYFADLYRADTMTHKRVLATLKNSTNAMMMYKAEGDDLGAETNMNRAIAARDELNRRCAQTIPTSNSLDSRSLAERLHRWYPNVSPY